MAAPQELFRCLSRFVSALHEVLEKSGEKVLKEELEEAVKKKSGGNFFTEMEVFKKLSSRWSHVLAELKNLSIILEKGDPADILNATKKLSQAISSLQIFIAEIFVNIGSFVPGPVGIVCNVVLAIGCFAVGDIPGGFMNLAGAIPFAKCARLFSKTDGFISMIYKSGLAKFNNTGILLENMSNWRIVGYSKNFARYFDIVVQDAKKRVSKLNLHKKMDKKTGIINSDPTGGLLNDLHDGWDDVRKRVFAHKYFHS